ncbi:MAG: hypothetical protein ABF429_04220 [Zymomonas mobilis]|uniref:hypothetical protein n=1 Tax=Zymomonas mobilis TaxID=542 RepID=UPI0001B7070E|nr:hypothetical protein [Zymomonas mobilis]ACV75460.1 hypothetical protein Za10_0914 [Zymomonas mobilis subsp. mobilis NCIMB 11163]
MRIKKNTVLITCLSLLLGGCALADESKVMASHHRVYYRCDDGLGMDTLFRDLNHDVQLTFRHGSSMTLQQVKTSEDVRYGDMSHSLIIKDKYIVWKNGRNAPAINCYPDNTMLIDQSVDRLSSHLSKP